MYSKNGLYDGDLSFFNNLGGKNEACISTCHLDDWCCTVIYACLLIVVTTCFAKGQEDIVNKIKI